MADSARPNTPRRLGDFEIVRELGRGGWGSHRAERCVCAGSDVSGSQLKAGVSFRQLR